jgi:hypothetical protein
MNKYSVRWSLLLVACALSAACQDRRDPVKPTVALAAAAAAVPAQS